MRVVVALVALAGCGFQAGALPGGASTDARAHDGSAGSDGSGSAVGACVHASCPAACEDTPSGPECYVPESCAEAQSHGQPANADTTLYANGSASSPWTAYCNGSNEYLTVSAASNFGQYAAGGASAGTTRTTNYARIRVYPFTLLVDINDETFAKSTGGPLTHSSSDQTVTSMPFAVAMDCVDNNSHTGQAEIDLTGTPFVVTSAWVDKGNNGSGAATSMSNGAIVMITGGGFCGWDQPSGYVPTGYQGNPFNPVGVGSNVSLMYAP